MRKLCTLLLLVLATAFGAVAQEDNSQKTVAELAHYATAPAARDALGRAVVEVVDQNGNPINNADVTLESDWAGGTEHCEAFGGTNSKGAIALLPIHIGDIKLVVKAKGYATYKAPVAPSDLGKPIRIELKKK
jgi:hypothetical protein